MRPNSTPCCFLLSCCFLFIPLFNILSSLSRLASLVSRLASFRSACQHPTAPGLNVSFTAAENQLTTRLIAAFTTFAKTGSPNVTGWQPYTAAARNGLTIGNGSSLVTGPLGAAASVCVDIWDKAGYLH